MTIGLPSGKITIPSQNMSHEILNVLIVEVAGSNTPAWRLWLLGSLPEPAMTNTLPVCIMATCTGLIGMRNGSVCHRPVRFGWSTVTARLAVACFISAGSMNGFGCGVWPAAVCTAAEKTSSDSAQANLSGRKGMFTLAPPDSYLLASVRTARGNANSSALEQHPDTSGRCNQS